MVGRKVKCQLKRAAIGFHDAALIPGEREITASCLLWRERALPSAQMG